MRTRILTVLCFCAVALAATPAFAGGVVVVAANSGVASLSKAQVKGIFLGKKKKLPDGTRAVPVNQPEGSPLYSAFNQKVLGKSDAKLKQYWSARMFSGKGNPPKVVKNDAEVIEHVTSQPGGIGYIDAASADDRVKVVYQFD